MDKSICHNCDKVFEPKRGNRNKKFCSRKCALEARKSGFWK